MAKKLKVVKNRGTLYLMTEDNEWLGIQLDMRVLSPSCGNKNHVIVSVDFRVPLEDFCTETIDEDKGELVTTIKGSDIALVFDRYKRMVSDNTMKEPQFPEDRIG